jgi:hypothetical protein
VAKVLLLPRRWERCVILFPTVWCLVTKEVGSGCDGGFFSSLSFPRKNAHEIPKKQLCHPLCNFFNFGHFSFNYCLFGFRCLLKCGFFFTFVSGYFIQFDLLFNLVPILLIALFLCFILFLIIIFLQFLHLFFNSFFLSLFF